MPKKPTPAAKQRVRTGCLICRKRRRKCDEQKPSCANCQAKGFTCKYASDLQFAPPLSGAVSGGKQGYSSITFVNESPVATGSKTREQQKPANDSQSNADLSVDGLENPVDDEDNSGDTSRAFEFQSIQSSAEPMADFSEPLVLSGGSRDAPDTRYMNSAPYFGYKSVAKERTAEKPELLANGSHETDLLRHFRYHVGPWIDTGDPELPFGLQVLLLSRTNKALQAAILALSAGQRLLVASPNTQDLESRHRFRKEAEEKLEREYDLARYAGQTLLMLQDVLPVGPLQWRNVLMPGIKHINDFASRAGEEEVAEGLLWLYFRLDLAGSISSAKPPLMDFQSFVREDGSFLHRSQHMRPQTRTVNSAYKHILCLLGKCLSLVHGSPEVMSPRTATTSDILPFPYLHPSYLASQWTFLWSECQLWYNERPVNVQQIVDIRGGEADQIDPDHDSSFPILIYTTPMALVANAVYHTICFLLLTHKPRLLKSLPGPRSVTSYIWHAQSIAGIAASNDSPEQWDPVLVASLLIIAKEMTHASQQSVLLNRLARITATTGIKLTHETEALQAAWNLARYEEEFDDEADMMVS